jgi:hypothetical protein
MRLLRKAFLIDGGIILICLRMKPLVVLKQAIGIVIAVMTDKSIWSQPTATHASVACDDRQAVHEQAIDWGHLYIRRIFPSGCHRHNDQGSIFLYDQSTHFRTISKSNNSCIMASSFDFKFAM